MNGVTMSRWDEYDRNRMLERLEERREIVRQNTEEYNKIIENSPPPTEQEILNWKNTQERILEEIRKGATSGDAWVLSNRWVELSDGRAFLLKENLPEINDDRIRKYMKSHKLNPSTKTIQEIRKNVFLLGECDAKNKIKEIIIFYRKHDKYPDCF